MGSLNVNAITKVATVSGVDMKTAGATTLYTVPAGKTFIPIAVVIRGNSASLAGGTDYDFTTWRQTVDLSGMTVTTGFRILWAADNTTYTPIAAAGTVQITVSTGSTAACTATLDVFGYLY
jgi:hypothetical protein